MVFNKKLKKLLLLGMVLVLVVGVVSATNFVNFLSGVFVNTVYDDVEGHVKLEGSNLVGNYTSGVFDMGSIARFDYLSWVDDSLTVIDCPVGMAFIPALGGYCIDKWEAHAVSGSTDEPFGSVTSTTTTSNILSGGGYAGSAQGESPWTYISQTQAKAACENADKYLCSNDQWQAAANIHGVVYNLPADLGGSPNFCVTNSMTDCSSGSFGAGYGSACLSGYYSGGLNNCSSSEGVFDMVGNVWEWVDEVWSFSIPSGCSSWAWCYLRDDGTWSSSTSGSTAVYGNDGTYFSATYSSRALRRGGSWSRAGDAGVFAVDLRYYASHADNGFGFRCCSS
jgi:hypothetical protein